MDALWDMLWLSVMSGYYFTKHLDIRSPPWQLYTGILPVSLGFDKHYLLCAFLERLANFSPSLRKPQRTLWNLFYLINKLNINLKYLDLLEE